MSVILDTYVIPEKGKVELKVNQTFEIKVTAVKARRQVRRWLRDEVSHLLSPDPPTLVLGERVVWRVPVRIGFPNVGCIGWVGTIEVDVNTGSMNNSSALKIDIECRTELLTAYLPPYQPKEDIPVEYVAPNIPLAPTLIIEDENTLLSITKE